MRALCGLLLTLALLWPPSPTQAKHATPIRHIIHGARITCYFATGNLTATGTVARFGEVATDPNVIPSGAWLTMRGVAGIFHAEDVGGTVIGAHVDVFVVSWPQAYRIQGSGYRDVTWWLG